MKPRNKASGNRRDASAMRKVPSCSGWRAVTLAAVGAGVVGLLIWKGAGPERVHPPPASPEGKPGAAWAASEQRVPEPESERALRAEQLQAAEKLLAEFPNNDDVVYLAGLVRNEQGDSDAAMKLWARSLELDATRADANESLGYALLLRDDYEQAVAYLRRALEIDP